MVTRPGHSTKKCYEDLNLKMPKVIIMKYIDAERLRAEIKFAKSVYDDPKRVVYGVADAYRQDGRAAMCDDILKKIDSLQQEQPEVDIKKELHAYICSDEYMNTREDGSLLIARHFYELGKNSK